VQRGCSILRKRENRDYSGKPTGLEPSRPFFLRPWKTRPFL
jgi:hypothetical protein